MKKLSIKLKLTLWFMLFMVVLAAVLFSFVSMLSSSESRRQTQDSLISMVNRNSREVRYEGGEVVTEEGFVSYRHGVYCLVFDEDREKCGGRTADDDLVDVAFEDGEVREVTVNGENYLIYDLAVTDKRRDIYLRGIVSESSTDIGEASLYSSILVSVPLLLLMAAAGGYLLARKSLEPITVISSTAEEIGESGDLTKRIEMDENGDELHRLAGTFNRMFDRLEKNFESERQFTSDASHELRTPITTILAQCEYAFENASGEEELYEVIGDIQKQGHRMARLVESLLSFTRMEQRTEEASFRDTDISACIRSVCAEQKELPEKGITLAEEIQQGVRMKADEVLISRMAGNLIRNAYRYGKEDGHITVKLSQDSSGIRLAVEDDGIGISEKDLPNIWNRFYRADRSRHYSEGTGLGLGLAMVKQIAEMHGGEVRAESEPGKGSVFTVLLRNREP